MREHAEGFYMKTNATSEWITKKNVLLSINSH